MDKLYFLNQSTSLTLVTVICIIFAVAGIYHSKKFQGINNYLTANRNIGVFSLTTSLVASALGAWVLFGPVAAATWGGIGAGDWIFIRNCISNDFFNLFRKKNSI
jgi:Na+/proline symporter